MTTHWMLDTETLDTKPSAVVLEISLMQFILETAEVKQKVNIVLNGNEQLKKGRTIDLNTLSFWSKNADHLFGLLQSGYKVPNGNHDLLKMITIVGQSDPKKQRIWMRGQDFDLPIMTSLLNDYGIKLPWGYSSGRDIRTIEELAQSLGWTKDTNRLGIYHNAHDDCLTQIRDLCSAYKYIQDKASKAADEPAADEPVKTTSHDITHAFEHMRRLTPEGQKHLARRVGVYKEEDNSNTDGRNFEIWYKRALAQAHVFHLFCKEVQLSPPEDYQEQYRPKA